MARRSRSGGGSDLPLRRRPGGARACRPAGRRAAAPPARGRASGRPLALSEVHLGGTRDEQLRWLVDLYEAAPAAPAHRRRPPVRALAAWAHVRQRFDWHNLVTREDGYYAGRALRHPRPAPAAHRGRPGRPGARPRRPPRTPRPGRAGVLGPRGAGLVTAAHLDRWLARGACSRSSSATAWRSPRRRVAVRVRRGRPLDPPRGRHLRPRDPGPLPAREPASRIGDPRFHPVCWYRTTIDVPPAERGGRVLVHFGAVDYAAKVWVNGRLGRRAPRRPHAVLRRHHRRCSATTGASS